MLPLKRAFHLIGWVTRLVAVLYILEALADSGLAAAKFAPVALVLWRTAFVFTEGNSPGGSARFALLATSPSRSRWAVLRLCRQTACHIATIVRRPACNPAPSRVTGIVSFQAAFRRSILVVLAADIIGVGTGAFSAYLSDVNPV